MRLPLSWLREFLPEIPAPDLLAERLTSLGIEVEAIETVECPCRGVVIVDVQRVRPHPEADRLVIADVWDGQTVTPVVCGAPNCRQGLRTAWAPPGSRLPGKDKPLVIQTALVRGVESFGMLCSLEELGIGQGSQGIWELGDDLPAGTVLDSQWQETVFHLSLTPNLGHAMSVLGIAREIGASFGLPLNDPVDHLNAFQHLPKGPEVKIEDADLCSQYHLLALQGPFAAPSPFLWQKRLLLAGIRPLHPLVDITNLVLLERGQPLHAFDAAKVKPAFIVREGRPEESCQLLDGTVVQVDGYPVIADQQQALAVAGVMGGESSAVSTGTVAILVECAVFNAGRVRSASKKLGVRSESSIRFERGVDSGGCTKALQRAAHLCALLGGQPTALTSVGRPADLSTIIIEMPWLRSRLGIHLATSEVEELLVRLRCHVQSDHDRLIVVPPSDRNDLKEPIDLVEEVARLYGYDHLLRKESALYLGALGPDPVYRGLERIREALVAQGLQEFLTCALISPQQAALVAHPLQARVSNPASEENSILRPSLLPGLLLTLKTNQAHREGPLAGFELGRIHLRAGDQKGYVEPWSAGVVLCGAQAGASWCQATADWDFFSGKGLLQGLTEALCLKGAWSVQPSQHPLLHPHRQALLTWDGHEMGRLGELHPQVVKDLGLRGRPIVAELAVQPWISALQGPAAKLKAPPEFPSTERDCTLPLPKRLAVDVVEQAIHQARPAVLEQWTLTTVYENPQEPDTHQVTWRFVYRDPRRTLTGAEVDSLQAELVEKLTSALASVQE